MPATPPDTTDRLKVTYTGPFGSHVITFHKVTAASTSDFIADAITVLTKMAKLLYAVGSFLDAAYALAGSPVFVPLSWTPIPSTGSSNPDANSVPSRFLNWEGRDYSGVRVAYYLFEVSAQGRNDMRFNAGEAALVDDVTAALVAAGGTIGTIAGGVAFWKNYANVGENAYLTHKARH